MTHRLSGSELIHLYGGAMLGPLHRPLGSAIHEMVVYSGSLGQWGDAE